MLRDLGVLFQRQTTTEYQDQARTFLSRTLHPRFVQPYPSLTYRPMLELIALLHRLEFSVIMCTDSSRDFIRVIAGSAYGLTREQVGGVVDGRGVPGRAARSVAAGCAAGPVSARSVGAPTVGQLDRIAVSAMATFEQNFCAQTVLRLAPDSRARLEAMTMAAAGTAIGLLSQIKADPGRVSLETLLGEVDKLSQVKALGLPAALFAGVSERVVAAWTARAMRAYPSDLRAADVPVRLTLLAALCSTRQAEITDGLVDLLNSLVLKISTQAERRVEGELLTDLRRVRNKDGLLFAVAGAALERPDDSVRSVVFPVVGETTLRDLVREAKANQQAFQTRVRTMLSGSYTNNYRRMLPQLLAALTFRSHNVPTGR